MQRQRPAILQKTKWDYVSWTCYVLFLIFLPLALLLTDQIINPSVSDQTQPSIWIGINSLLRFFLPIRAFFDEFKKSSIVTTYLVVSIGWAIYGLALIAMQIAYYTDFFLWTLLLATYVTDFSITVCLYPGLLLIEKCTQEETPATRQTQPQTQVQRELNILIDQLNQNLQLFGDLERIATTDQKVDEKKVVTHSFYNTCPVCHEQFKETDQVKEMPCKHIFHPQCLDPWFQQGHNTCPTCRQAL